MLFVHQSYRPPMRPGRTRSILNAIDQAWRTLAALVVALLVGGDIVMGAWALDQAGHTLWAIALDGGSLFAVVLLLALYFAGAVTPTRKETTVHDDDQNAEEYRQWRRQRGGWCSLTLGATAAVATLIVTLVTSRPPRRPPRPTAALSADNVCTICDGENGQHAAGCPGGRR